MATGTVKWFNATKGYGFIQPDGGGKDVFVHISAVERAGFSSLAEGAKVSYEIVSDRGKESAGNLRLSVRQPEQRLAGPMLLLPLVARRACLLDRGRETRLGCSCS